MSQEESLVDLGRVTTILKDSAKAEKEEAKALLSRLVSWAKTEIESGRDLDAIEWPKGGGELEGMSVKEAVARVDALLGSLDEKATRKLEGERIAKAVLETGLRILTRAAIAAVA